MDISNLKKGDKVRVIATTGYLAQFRGQMASATEHLGASGETRLFDLQSGRGLYFRADEVEAA